MSPFLRGIHFTEHISICVSPGQIKNCFLYYYEHQVTFGCAAGICGKPRNRNHRNNNSFLESLKKPESKSSLPIWIRLSILVLLRRPSRIKRCIIPLSYGTTSLSWSHAQTVHKQVFLTSSYASNFTRLLSEMEIRSNGVTDFRGDLAGNVPMPNKKWNSLRGSVLSDQSNSLYFFNRIKCRQFKIGLGELFPCICCTRWLGACTARWTCSEEIVFFIPRAFLS